MKNNATMPTHIFDYNEQILYFTINYYNSTKV